MTGASASAGRADERVILHVDMDAFFVGVELLDRPDLVGRPVVVGGAGRRGVVASASYEARSRGVRSAMPMAQARRLCPDLIVLGSDHRRYSEVSRRIMALFADVTPLVEPLSLDEAFLDVTGAHRSAGDPLVLAAAIRERVATSEGLGCSVGIGPSKLVAKLASQAAKPRASPGGPVVLDGGVRWVRAADVPGFLGPLPVDSLWGVGPATGRRLARLGVRTIGDLAAIPPDSVARALGPTMGPHLHDLARGIDDRPVLAGRDRVSVGHEQTFATDLRRAEDVALALHRLADAVSHRLRTAGQQGRTITLKVRTADFQTSTRSRTLRAPTDDTAVLRTVVNEMVAALDLDEGIRLLGISVTQLGAGGPEQLSFDDHLGADRPGAGRVDPARPTAGEVAHRVRERFGHAAIVPAALLTGPGDRTRGEERRGHEG